MPAANLSPAGPAATRTTVWTRRRGPRRAAPRRSPPTSQLGRGRLDLLGGRGALHRQHRTPAPPGAAPSPPARQRRDRSRGDHVEALAVRAVLRSARARTSTRRGPAGHDLVRKVVRRASGSIRVTRRSGRRDGEHQPGQSRTRAHVGDGAPGSSAASSAQLTRCRSHSRGTSRGPISPRTHALGRQERGVPLGEGAASRGEDPASTAGSGGGGVSRETWPSGRAAPPRSDAARHPRTPRSDRRRRRRRARPCARRASSAAARPARRSPSPGRPWPRPAPRARGAGARWPETSSISRDRSPVSR